MKKILLWQLSALGIEFGGAQLRGYIEGGFGTQGFALAGIRYKFWSDTITLIKTLSIT